MQVNLEYVFKINGQEFGIAVETDTEDETYQMLVKETHDLTYAERKLVIATLEKRLSKFVDAFLFKNKQKVFDFATMSNYTRDDFLFDASQCAYTKSTLLTGV